MNQLSRNKVLLSIIAVLLITNLVMLFWFFNMHRPGKEQKSPGFTEQLKTNVGFTKEQMAEFEPRKNLFWENMRKRFNDIKAAKVELYQFMYDPNAPDSLMETKAEVIGDQQKEMDLYVVRHFKEVRKLCTPEQLPKFDSLLPPIIERMTARPARKR